MIVLVTLASLMLGSLLTLITIRLPRERRLLGWPRCTRTGEPLLWWQWLPLIGWVAQRGRARNGAVLHWIYPSIEALTVAVVVVLYQQHDLSPTFLYLVLVSAILIVIGAVDWLFRSIYVVVVFGGTALVLLANLGVPAITLLDAGLGALAGGFVFLLFFLLARILFPAHAAPFGLGDVYLAIFIGAALGLTRLGAALVYGMLLAGLVAAGIVFARRVLKRSDTPTYLPYGSYLCLGAIIYLLVWGLP